MDSPQEYLEKLSQWFLRIEGSITAFSGGVDSALVLRLSRIYLGKEKAIGCIADAPSLKRSDLAEAQGFCRRFDIRLEIINTNEIEDANYFTNPTNRCFACKSHLYQDLSKLASRFPGYRILNGTNCDDFGDYRPGLQAAKEQSVLSPLADCGMTKADVRALARHLELPNWDKPASPCLSSRIPYGQTVTREKLQQIETAESVLERYGFTEARVRHYGHKAKIEVPASQIEPLTKHLPKIQAAILGLGFAEVSLDPEGLVSGKLNRAILPQK